MIVNGVTIPDIPAEVLAEKPNAVVTHTVIYGKDIYSLAVSSQPFDHGSAELLGQEMLLTHGEGQNYMLSNGVWDDLGTTSHSPFGVQLGEVTVEGMTMEYTLVWTNQTEFKEIVWIDLDAMEWGTEPKEEKPTRYSIATAILDSVARQIMRLTGNASKVYPEDFEEKLKSVDTGGNTLPVAENTLFGEEKIVGEYGMVSTGAIKKGNKDTYGYSFTPAEDFTIIGFRIFARADSTMWGQKITLWDADGTQLVRKSISYKSEEWVELYFDTPVNVKAGNSYTVGTYGWPVDYFESAVFNPKLTNVKTLGTGTVMDDVRPTVAESRCPCGDIIIGTMPEELPDEYIVQRETMDGIAQEIQRITGNDEKISTDQIITVLQGIAVQTASTEE